MKYKNKTLKIIVIILLTIISLLAIVALSLFGIMRYMKKDSDKNRYYDRGFEIIPKADYIVVPGAQIRKDAPNKYLRYRLDYAYRLYTEGKAPKIIVSGAFDTNVYQYESDVMYEYLCELGVKKEDIIIDLNGSNTYETLKRTKEFVGNKSIIICTQDFYSYRTNYIAEKLDLNAVIFCSDPVIYSYKFKSKIREYLAQAKAILNCTILQPETTTLEESPFYFIQEVK